jgi:effector-binding domain-containing protein
MTESAPSLAAAREQALAVRSLYETLEQRFNGKTWSLHELMIGFSHDVGHIGRLLLAHDGTWGIDGDPRAELEHKLAESMWWTFVLADRLGIDVDEAYARTMERIRAGLEATIARTDPTASEHLHAGDDPEHVRTPAVTYVAVLGDGAPGTDEFYRKKALVADIAGELDPTTGPSRVEEIQYWYPDGSDPVEIADFYSVNPVPSLLYRVLSQVPAGTGQQDVDAARTRAASAADTASDELTVFTIPEQDVVQVMHHGPFAEELTTLGRLGELAQRRGVRRSGPHHEIHLDPFTRSTPQDTLRTILRDPVARANVAG